MANNTIKAEEGLKKKDITFDADDNLVLPPGYSLVREKTRLERIQERITRLEKDLQGIKEPSQEQLIQEGRMMHPFYMLSDELEYLNNELKKL